MRVKILLATALASVMAIGPAAAMGSGDPFVDQQTGVNYTVYKPSWTAGRELIDTNGLPCGEGNDEGFTANYGLGAGSFLLLQGNPECSNGGDARRVAVRTINGQRAEVWAACDVQPGCWSNPNRATAFFLNGGWLKFTQPKQPNQTPTIIQVAPTRGGITIAQVVRLARSLKPAVELSGR